MPVDNCSYTTRFNNIFNMAVDNMYNITKSRLSAGCFKKIASVKESLF